MYKVGEYIILRDNKSWFKNYAVICSINNYKYYIKVFYPNLRSFRHYRKEGDYFFTWVYNYVVVRSMTLDEKEELMVSLDAEKFNI